MDETELIQDEVNDLPGDERDAGWDADDEYEAGPVNVPGGSSHGDCASRPGMIVKP